MELSRRLLSVANGVSKGNRLADVGTDHGYIPIFLVQKGVIPSAIAMDINKGPLERAMMHIEEQGLSNQIETRLGSGLSKLEEDETDSVVIAGMGGALITRILEEGLPVLKGRKTGKIIKELILQPQSEIFKVRHWLHDNGYLITEENLVQEEGKYYFILKAVQGKQIFSEEYLYEYGEFLLKEGNPLMKEYLSKEREKFQNIEQSLKTQESEAVRARREELKAMIGNLEKAIYLCENNLHKNNLCERLS